MAQTVRDNYRETMSYVLRHRLRRSQRPDCSSPLTYFESMAVPLLLASFVIGSFSAMYSRFERTGSIELCPPLERSRSRWEFRLLLISLPERE